MGKISVKVGLKHLSQEDIVALYLPVRKSPPTVACILKHSLERTGYQNITVMRKDDQLSTARLLDRRLFSPVNFCFLSESDKNKWLVLSN